jgi:hypothetical protein
VKITNQEAQQIAAALIAFDGRQEDGKVIDRITLPWQAALGMARNRRLLTAALQDYDQARRDIIAARTGGALQLADSDPGAAMAHKDLSELAKAEIELDLARLKAADLDTDANRKAAQPLLALLIPILDV